MSGHNPNKQKYMVSISEMEDSNGVLIFTFVPRGLQQERGAGGIPANWKSPSNLFAAAISRSPW